MRPSLLDNRFVRATFLIGICSVSRLSLAQEEVSVNVQSVLTAQEWDAVDESVERGLAWIASQQQRDGSFPTMPQAQPGVTGLCVLAFMTHGHLPGQGEYGTVVQKAINFIMNCQKPNGLLALVAPNRTVISRMIGHDVGYTVPYNHAIGGLVLTESFAMNPSSESDRQQLAIQQAMAATLEMHAWPKDRAEDKGGWRYLDDYDDHDSDLSVTGWQLMFLRSAKNAGFDVPEEPITEAIGYVRRAFREDSHSFSYYVGPDNRCSRGMAGAGVLALAHSGLHNTREARLAGEWILQSGFDQYNGLGRLSGGRRGEDRYHYGLLTCCPAMYQLGGDLWLQFFPPTVQAILAGQNADGSWQRENFGRDQGFGTVYTSAICVFALGAPNQFLPVFQR